MVVESGSHYPSLALDSHARPHICYTRSQAGWLYSEASLNCAHWTGTEWITDTIEFDFYVDYRGFLDISLSIDNHDNLHISYYDATKDELKYGYGVGSLWTTQTIESNVHMGGDTSLALDENNKPHISYIDWPDTERRIVKYLFQTDGGWQIQKVVDTNYHVYNTSLALAQDGHPHIGYYSLDYSVDPYVQKINYAVGVDPIGVIFLPIIQRQ